ncbi:MAG: FtsW/RodA/SpoVE family cell cycle protein, partial [bacterium]
MSASLAGKPDRPLFLAILILLAIGIMMVLSASVLTAEARFSRPYLFLVKQLVWVALGLAALVLCSRVDYHRLQPAARWA